MTKYLYIAILWASAAIGYAQIAINTDVPDPSAELTIESVNRGVVFPRMTTLQKEAIAAPASGLLVYDTSKKCLSMNAGTPAIPNWICATQNTTRFFYMPSINIPTPALGAVATPLDLYAEYKKQFGTPMYKSPSAPAQIPNYLSATALDYYITHYDSDVMSVTNIDNTGKVSYFIHRKSDLDTYMNVVFVVK